MHQTSLHRGHSEIAWHAGHAESGARACSREEQALRLKCMLRKLLSGACHHLNP